MSEKARGFWAGFTACASLVALIVTGLWPHLYIARVNESQVFDAHRRQPDGMLFSVGHRPDSQFVWEWHQGAGMMVIESNDPKLAADLQAKVIQLLYERR